VDTDLIEMSRVYKVPVKRQICKLYLPSVLPHVLQSSGAALGFGVKLVVSAEVLSRVKNGLGNLLKESEILSEMPTLFALLIVSCILAFLLESAFAVLSARMQRRAK
jgi:NitT/TauT family transport system permease protein